MRARNQRAPVKLPRRPRPPPKKLLVPLQKRRVRAKKRRPKKQSEVKPPVQLVPWLKKPSHQPLKLLYNDGVPVTAEEQKSAGKRFGKVFR